MNRAKNLITQLVSNPDSSKVDLLANELLALYHHGSPVESLRSLLSSENDRLAGEGAWIASELGETGKPLLRDIASLLGHRSKKVRFWSIDCVQLWAGPSNGCEVASTVALVDDAEEAVRWKAMGFLALASDEQLQAAVAQITAADRESPYLDELRWMLAAEGSDPDQITGGFEGTSSRHRKFAVAAAFRIAKTDPALLRRAASADDPEIAQFAGDMLKRISSF